MDHRHIPTIESASISTFFNFCNHQIHVISPPSCAASGHLASVLSRLIVTTRNWSERRSSVYWGTVHRRTPPGLCPSGVPTSHPKRRFTLRFSPQPTTLVDMSFLIPKFILIHVLPSPLTITRSSNRSHSYHANDRKVLTHIYPTNALHVIAVTNISTRSVLNYGLALATHSTGPGLAGICKSILIEPASLT